MLFSYITCREALERLDDYLDRELTGRDVALVDRHLRICRRCARQFAAEATFVEDLRTKLKHMRAPAGLLDKLIAELPSEPAIANCDHE